MRLKNLMIVCPALATSVLGAEELPLRTVYQFPQKQAGFSWLGNLAVRPSGPLLLTTVNNSTLFQLDANAANPKPVNITHFPKTTATTGITETVPDTFAVVAGIFNLTTQEFLPNSGSLRNVSFPSPTGAPKVDHILDLNSTIKIINGLTSLPDRPTLALGSDSFTGTVWSFDTLTGVQEPVISQPLLSPHPPTNATGSKLGVNGLKVAKEGCDTWLYFTNTAKTLLGKLQIDGQTGRPVAGPAGQAQVLARTPGASQGVGFDDFALRSTASGVQAWLADSRGNSISVWDSAKPKNVSAIVNGAMNHTEILEPEAVAFGRTDKDCETLYVVTTGGFGNRKVFGLVEGGQVLAVDTRKL